jgi:hypothetical protein
MKKLYNPLPAGGAPLYTETLDDALQLEIWDAIEGILSDVDPHDGYPFALRNTPTLGKVTNGFLISGGAVTDNGATWDIADGIVYFPATKQFARFAGITGVVTATEVVIIQLDAPVVTQKTFFDATLKNYYETYTATASVHIATNPTPSDAVVVYKDEVLGGFPNTLMGHPTFGNHINQINKWTVDNGKQTVIILNSWTDGGCFYRKMGGVVHVGINVGNSVGATNDIVFTLPATGNYRPAATEIATGIAVATVSGNSYPVTVNSNGDVAIVGASTQPEGPIFAQFSFLEANFNL